MTGRRDRRSDRLRNFGTMPALFGAGFTTSLSVGGSGGHPCRAREQRTGSAGS